MTAKRRWNQNLIGATLTKELEMKTRLILALVFGAIGFFIGSGMGIASGGDAFNGGRLFGLIGLVIGFLLGAKQNRFWIRRKD